jgi:hypothetical protein
MANSVIETQKFLILHELFMTNEQQVNDLSCDRYQGKSLAELLKEEVRNWDLIKKNPLSIYKLDALANTQMTANGADAADTWIVPVQFQQFITIMQSAATDPNRVGATLAASRFNDGPDAFTSFNGSRIRVTRVMATGEISFYFILFYFLKIKYFTRICVCIIFIVNRQSLRERSTDLL